MTVWSTGVPAPGGSPTQRRSSTPVIEQPVEVNSTASDRVFASVARFTREPEASDAFCRSLTRVLGDARHSFGGLQGGLRGAESRALRSAAPDPFHAGRRPLEPSLRSAWIRENEVGNAFSFVMSGDAQRFYD